jgi:hypothetical protein
MADDRLYDVARILKLPPDWPTLLARIQELEDTRVQKNRTAVLAEDQLWTLVLAACRLARDEVFSTEQEIAAALRITVKTWRRMSGPGGDQELRDLGHVDLGDEGRGARRFRLIDVLAWDAERQRRAAERRKK